MDTLAKQAARLIVGRFNDYGRTFGEITQRASERFARAEWHAAQADGVARLHLYTQAISQLLEQLRALLGEHVVDRELWTHVKVAYTHQCGGRDDFILAETFYNSITRRLFTSSEPDPACEYLDNEIAPPPVDDGRAVYSSYANPPSAAVLMQAVLSDALLPLPFENLERDAHLVGARIEHELAALYDAAPIDAADVVRAVFYRNKGAYLIGRLRQGERLIPLIVPLLNVGGRAVVDAVLLTEDAASIVFSFTRSYFLVDAPRAHELVAFLLSIMPLKRRSELYTSLGHNRHGKTELWRRLQLLMATTDERFEAARGEPGLVMTVFTTPSLAVVFKVIKDRFGFPKNTTRQRVIERYQLVMRHDRAGRLADAQAFEHMRFPKRCFAPPLLDHLLKVAGNTVVVDDEWVVIKHVYTERRMTPLNLYIKEAPPEAVRAAVIDFGQAIKDLAATNIFPGDVLLKNFGVTRHGRVVFYDYDELCLLTDCVFRAMPAARDYDDELAGEPWFHVGEHDIFPEEFRTFLGLPPDLRDLFTEHHGDLFGVAFWQAMQERHRSGAISDLFAYSEEQRLRPSLSAAE